MFGNQCFLSSDALKHARSPLVSGRNRSRPALRSTPMCLMRDPMHTKQIPHVSQRNSNEDHNICTSGKQLRYKIDPKIFTSYFQKPKFSGQSEKLPDSLFKDIFSRCFLLLVLWSSDTRHLPFEEVSLQI